MLRVAVSIGAGKIKPSTVLRRLATYSIKNKLYFAFRELGYALRTIFLLEYLSDDGPPKSQAIVDGALRIEI